MFRTAGLAMLSRPQALMITVMASQMRFAKTTNPVKPVVVQKVAKVAKPMVVQKVAKVAKPVQKVAKVAKPVVVQKVAKPEGYPKGATTGFFFFLKENRAKIAAANPTLAPGPLGKKFGVMYHALPATDKARYATLAIKDKKRYTTEMAKYLANGGVKVARLDKKGRVKKVKDPNFPKRGLSAFFMFVNEKRAEVVKAVGSDPRNIGKRMGELWAAVSPAEKARCEGLAAKDKLRYIKELKAGGYPVPA